MKGTLFLIPNTLGPCEAEALHWMVPAQVQQLTASLSNFVAENAKTTRAFLKLIAASYPLTTPLQNIQINELHVNTPAAQLPALLAPLLAGKDVGLISEAGVPAVADPGANLVRLAHQHEIVVRPMVGPSSLLLAVMASGLNGQSFAFNGYLPIDVAKRNQRIRELEVRSSQDQQTQLMIETPYRNQAMLESLANHCRPQTLICVATDLTLSSESIITRTAADWKEIIGSDKAPQLARRPSVFLLLAS